jgi:dUTPase
VESLKARVPWGILHTRRIAQLLILPVPEVEWEEVEELPPSERGELGFGSSG